MPSEEVVLPVCRQCPKVVCRRSGMYGYSARSASRDQCLFPIFLCWRKEWGRVARSVAKAVVPHEFEPMRYSGRLVGHQ